MISGSALSDYAAGQITRLVIGVAVVALGGGRRKAEDSIDHAVGVTRLLPVGAEVRQGDALAIVHARSGKSAEEASAVIRHAYHLGEQKPAAQKAVLRRILPD